MEGLHKLVDALEEPVPGSSSGSGSSKGEKAEGEVLGRRGVVTICNHTSVVDDPMVSLEVSQSEKGLCQGVELISCTSYFPVYLHHSAVLIDMVHTSMTAVGSLLAVSLRMDGRFPICCDRRRDRCGGSCP